MKNKIILLVVSVVFIGGVVSSFFLARFIDASLHMDEERIYVDDAKFISDNIVSVFSDVSSRPSLVDSLALIDVSNPEDFDTLSISLVGKEGVTRVSLIHRVGPSLEQDFVSQLEDIYNSTITPTYISEDPIEGDLFVLTHTSPRLLDLVGLVVNSDESRGNMITEAIRTGESVVVDNVILADTGQLGRIVFHPISDSEEISQILGVVINYRDLFDPLTEHFISIFPQSDIEIFIEGERVFDTDSSIDLGVGDSIETNFNELTITISDFEGVEYSDAFIYMFVAGVLIVIAMSVGLFLLNRDRTRAIRDSKFKSRFIADISHEIRTPMNGILGMTELLSEQPLGSASRYYVKTIQSCGTTLMRIISNILDMSKIEAGVIEINEVVVNIRQLANETVENIWETHRMHKGVTRKKLQTVLEISKDVPEEIISDDVRIRQILSNLLTNSLKFTERGSVKIEISRLGCSEEKGDFIRVSVSDTGSGMTPEGVNKAFDPFKQVHLRRDMGGTGLGLSISKQLCGLMGGKIECSSEIGRGTTVVFTVRLKVESGSVTQSCMQPFRRVFVNGSIDMINERLCTTSSSSDALEVFERMVPIDESDHPDILVVDDVRVNRELLVRMFRTIGLEAKTCDNGVQAVQACETNTYSLILMDMVMPVMDGMKACKLIRSCGLNKSTPVVFVSANAQSTSVDECKQSGGNGFVTKPIKKRSLIDLFLNHSSPEEIEYVRRCVCDTRKL